MLSNYYVKKNMPNKENKPHIRVNISFCKYLKF